MELRTQTPGQRVAHQTDATARGHRTRIESIDIVRGAVMVLMALDHVRDYVTNVRFQPEDLAQSNTALFLTRWVTHFCAPAFFLLAGVGIGLMMSRGMQPAKASRFLFTRGLWLLALDLVITPIGWNLSLDLLPAFALVLWALGWSMIVLAVLIHVPRSVLAVICIALIAGHNLFDAVNPQTLGAWAGAWHFLHAPGFAIPGVLFIGYPLIPWIAVMGLGVLLANCYEWEPPRRRRLLVITGAACCVAFIVLRAMNGYGNAVPWAEQRSFGLTVSSFLNLRKYPPSLQFLLMTLGPALIALALVEQRRARLLSWLEVYGRVPLFFYVMHIFVAHVAAISLALVQQGELMRIPIIGNPQAIPADHGLPLIGVYAVWLLVVVLLYYPCKRFAQLKQTRDDWWLRYL